MPNDDILATLGITEAEAEAIAARLDAGEPTERDLELLNRTWPHVQDAINATIEALNGILGCFGGFDIKPIGPTYRTEPIPGAELGGTPRNPEADIIDEIDRLVEWQMKQGER